MAIKRNKSFTKDQARVPLSDKEFQWLCDFVARLNARQALPPEARDHALEGEWKGFREFHIGGDKMVIYRVLGDDVQLFRLGTHAQLFKM